MSCNISVVVATYNAKYDKLLFTLDSLLAQVGMDLEIVIADDGSSNNHFTQIRDYFNKRNFNNFKLCSHEKNQGTVINYRDGIALATGEYVKLISPGDALLDFDDINTKSNLQNDVYLNIEKSTLLSDWLLSMKKENKRWSFCDVVYYRINDNGQKELMSQIAKPISIKPYLKSENEKCRWNYLVLDDFPIGASILCERKLLLSYLNRIAGKVIYAEDNAFRIMMFDNILPSYFKRDALAYEYGGVSTDKNDVWKHRLLEDLYSANEEMIASEIKDDIQKKVVSLYTKKKNSSYFARFIIELRQKGKIKNACVRHFCPRITNT